MMPAIEYVTEEQLRARLAAVYAAHPGLEAAADRFADAEECTCCVESDLGARYGWDAAQEVGSVRFLLGLDR